jgi:hypothetical protein
MNVKTPLFSHASKSDASSPSASPTPAHVTTADSSGPSQHYWTMSQYLEISLPLTTAVILLPLIAGPCFKFCSQQYEVHRRHWRALFVVFIACYSVVLIGLVIMVYIRHSLTWWKVYMYWTYLFYAANLGVHALRASSQKQYLAISLLLLLIFMVCMMLEHFYPMRAPWAIIALWYMFLTSKMGVRWVKRFWTWLSWETRRQTVTQYSSVATV